MRPGRLHIRSLALTALALSLWLLLPVQAFARALVRFIHGVPGVGAATVSINGQRIGSVAFGQVSSWHSLRSGRFTWTLSRGSTKLASGTATVGSGAYDIVVLERSGTVVLGVYRASGGRPGTSLIRVIHGAPEFGSPALAVDGHTAVPSLGYTRATPYVPLAPGSHHLAAMRPGSRTSLLGATVTLHPDVAYSAIVLGTRGQRVRVVEVVDRGAPLTRRIARAAAPHHRAGQHAAGHRSTAATAPATATATATHGAITVAPGQSLWDIARRQLGPSASDAQIQALVVSIWDRNVTRIGTGDPNLIFPGTRLDV